MTIEEINAEIEATRLMKANREANRDLAAERAKKDGMNTEYLRETENVKFCDAELEELEKKRAELLKNGTPEN